jgi:hypothetical protein
MNKFGYKVVYIDAAQFRTLVWITCMPSYHCSSLQTRRTEQRQLSIRIMYKSYREFVHDVTTAMLVFRFKIILIRLFCLGHQHGRHGLCRVCLWVMSANALFPECRTF